jgi:hypothetical protein
MRVRNGALATTALVLAGAIGAAPAGANHSTAEIAISGLTLTKSDVISMDSEDLYISPSSVRVIYRFTNTTDEPTNVSRRVPAARQCGDRRLRSGFLVRSFGAEVQDELGRSAARATVRRAGLVQGEGRERAVVSAPYSATVLT